MDLEAKYRAFAATCVELAEHAASSAEKLCLLDMGRGLRWQTASITGSIRP